MRKEDVVKRVVADLINISDFVRAAKNEKVPLWLTKEAVTDSVKYIGLAVLDESKDIQAVRNILYNLTYSVYYTDDWAEYVWIEEAISRAVLSISRLIFDVEEQPNALWSNTVIREKELTTVKDKLCELIMIVKLYTDNYNVCILKRNLDVWMNSISECIFDLSLIGGTTIGTAKTRAKNILVCPGDLSVVADFVIWLNERINDFDEMLKE